MLRVAERKEVNKDFGYDNPGSYAASTYLLETLILCSDSDTSMTVAEINLRCICLCGYSIHPKTIRKTLNEWIGMKDLLIRRFGGYVAYRDYRAKKGCSNTIRRYYYWQKTDVSIRREKTLRDLIKNDPKNEIYVTLLNKLGLSADLENENKWRSRKGMEERLNEAAYVEVAAPYLSELLAQEYKQEKKGELK